MSTIECTANAGTPAKALMADLLQNRSFVQCLNGGPGALHGNSETQARMHRASIGAFIRSRLERFPEESVA